MSYVYNGDVNLEHGGAFINLDDWHYGYASAVRVTDLDSGCGFTGACMIEHIVIVGIDDSKRIRHAMASCGYLSCNPSACVRSPGTSPAEHKRNLRHMIADALMSYGHTDPDDAWDSYQSYHTEIVQMENDGPMSFDGWKADKRLRGNDLMGYVKAVHLRD